MIIAENVSFSYGSNKVLKNLSLKINEGEFVALVGHNGSGKSTFAKLLNANLIPTAGTVTIDGFSTSLPQNIFDVRKRVGMVFQNPDNQLIATIVEDDVAFAPENLGLPPHEIRRRVDSALDAVGMRKYAGHAPHLLSGGQKQRVAIAGIFAMLPRYIVLDEPTAMLDPKGRKQVINSIKKLNKEQNITIVLITHYMEEAVSADRVVVMNKGSIFMEGTPREIFPKVESLKKIGLSAPPVTQLMHLLSRAGMPVSPNIITVDECVNELKLSLNGGSYAGD